MKAHRLLAPFILMVGFLSLAVPAAETRQERAVSGFNAVSLGVPARMEVIQGDREGIVLEGEASDLENVETAVEDRTLRIRSKEKWHFRWSDRRLSVTVYARQVEGLSISGSGRIHARSIHSPALSLAISGSGNVEIPSIETDKASMSISGSGKMQVAGKAATLDMHISGSGDMLAEKLESRQASIHISGAGDARLWARDALRVRIAGAGDVRYYGDPTIEQRIAGSGSVKRLGAAPS
jgi:hypothetical protein